ncbi:hypothetical protein KEM63_10525 [Halopseudomonas nanhaiensis]|uniref:hypothetical protein n=1 Tax=Halopseudomonas nanhaiensis TaxID=2830842 RepID=UPI001CC0F770|nr:hypothetical protein [Halopseudomonas nanhaiensis]UAW97260.1 hypothetical protein KEM63_10525 [Halopseudomonas nanhaiensis]
MSKPSRRRSYAVLACLAMLMHVLGMPALASASAEVRLAYGIGGHCLGATASITAAAQADAHDHHLHPPGSASLVQTEQDAHAPSSVDPASPCCCASAQPGVALATAAVDTVLPILVPARPMAADIRRTSPRQLRPAINPRAPPAQLRLT